MDDYTCKRFRIIKKFIRVKEKINILATERSVYIFLGIKSQEIYID